jgi:hypothetical protein
MNGVNQKKKLFFSGSDQDSQYFYEIENFLANNKNGSTNTDTTEPAKAQPASSLGCEPPTGACQSLTIYQTNETDTLLQRAIEQAKKKLGVSKEIELLNYLTLNGVNRLMGRTRTIIQKNKKRYLELIQEQILNRKPVLYPHTSSMPKEKVSVNRLRKIHELLLQGKIEEAQELAKPQENLITARKKLINALMINHKDNCLLYFGKYLNCLNNLLTQ